MRTAMTMETVWASRSQMETVWASLSQMVMQRASGLALARLTVRMMVKETRMRMEMATGWLKAPGHPLAQTSRCSYLIEQHVIAPTNSRGKVASIQSASQSPSIR